MTADVPGCEAGDAVPSLPEKIEPADLDTLNEALARVFDKLRFASGLPPGETNGRPGTVVALNAVWRFLTRFEAALKEGLHIPLLNLSGALVALNENNIEPILKPPPNRSGRAPSSPARYALIGIAVGAAQRLEWTGLSPADADRTVATKLNSLGIKPTRGKNDFTADTLRRWREQIKVVRPLLRSESQLGPQDVGARDRGWMNAANIADEMLTEEDRAEIAVMALVEARRSVLSKLERNIRRMMLAFPVKPPS
jgi:hypothetical protein